MSPYHIPVLLKESIEGLDINPGGTYVDATFGGGGHSSFILKRLKQGHLYAFDQDEEAKKNVPEDERFVFIDQNFRNIKKMLRAYGVTETDGIIADLGISSHQVDTPKRGFAHRLNGDLDMRMDNRSTLTAEEVVNSYDQEQLQKIFGEYGEVRNARTLAKLICESRNANDIENIETFIEVISPVIKGNRNRYLSQVFQALRIEVNDELSSLKDFLGQTIELLKKGGRLVMITYHSLEDRIVKNFMRYGTTTGEADKDFFGKEKKYFRLITKKAVEPGEEEIEHNPRARSAHLRIAEKI